jgi:hypothetical protein
MREVPDRAGLIVREAQVLAQLPSLRTGTLQDGVAVAVCVAGARGEGLAQRSPLQLAGRADVQPRFRPVAIVRVPARCEAVDV